MQQLIPNGCHPGPAVGVGQQVRGIFIRLQTALQITVPGYQQRRTAPNGQAVLATQPARGAAGIDQVGTQQSALVGFDADHPPVMGEQAPGLAWLQYTDPERRSPL
ncbi:hypothetical protein D9M71_763280 [compost metagenome]